jgi:hypothetical protein
MIHFDIFVGKRVSLRNFSREFRENLAKILPLKTESRFSRTIQIKQGFSQGFI